MFLNQEDIENILYLIPDSFGIMDLLAPLEIERLSDVLYSALIASTEGQEAVNPKVNFEQWALLVKNKISKELNIVSDSFAIKDLVNKLAMNEFLQKFYEYEYGEIN